jgi:uncharacterized membrane protein
MPNLTHMVIIDLPLEKVYVISQNYSLRYEWDPFPESIELLDGARTIEIGTRVRIVAKSGLKMIVEFVQVYPPEVTTIKMIKGPFVLKTFAGSWLFKSLPDSKTKAIFKYTIKAKSWTLPFISDRFITWYFSKHVQARLNGLKRYCEQQAEQVAYSD